MEDFGFSKEERVKLKKDFELLYSAGKRIYSRNGKLKAIFVLQESERSSIKVAVAVHKKAGKAVWRNRVKRLLREAYRLNKQLISFENLNQKELLIVLSANNINQKKTPKLFLKEVTGNVIELIQKINKSIE